MMSLFFPRDKQKGEFFVHGFTLAMTAQNRFYRPISEQDTQRLSSCHRKRADWKVHSFRNC